MHFKQLSQGLKAKMMAVTGGWRRGVVTATSQHLGSLFSRTVISNLPWCRLPPLHLKRKQRNCQLTSMFLLRTLPLSFRERHIQHCDYLRLAIFFLL